MTKYPDVQKKAQDEIDRVVGINRLSSWSDRGNLPYIEAILEQTLRWHPVATICPAHASTEDDFYAGHFIPQSAMIFANIWSFSHDTGSYVNADVFQPERFLGPHPELDPHEYVFGFGRRVCPGSIIASKAVGLNIAQSLAVFDISKSIENGVEVMPRDEMSNGIISHPLQFKNVTQPRSQHRFPPNSGTNGKGQRNEAYALTHYGVLVITAQDDAGGQFEKCSAKQISMLH